MMSIAKREAARNFANAWEGKGYEKGESQAYWNTLLRDILGIERPEEFIEYEDRVLMDNTTGFIDAYIPSSKVLIEQKGINVDLHKPLKQSDGSFLTPFQQAKRYIVNLPFERHPRWVVTCNFREIHVYDMNKPEGEPEVILLKDLPKEYHRLSFITDSANPHLKKEMRLSLQAGEIVGELYDALSKRYRHLETDVEEQKSLNQLIVRIVFCLYAEDADLFDKNQFHDYLNAYPSSGIRQALINLFQVLDTPEDCRDDLYLTDDVMAFPYVNGRLFSHRITIPQITDEIKNLLLAKASDDFQWSEISPTIFGAVFESTLNPETRRSGGMHYTSIENIHKVIDPLFLDDLRSELERIKKQSGRKTIKKDVEKFRKKLASLKFFDPAAGSGNFLTETYLSLRKLENEALEAIPSGEKFLLDGFMLVSISQFYGIEINDFAVSVAQTALWIAESQMNRETEDIVKFNIESLPLKSSPNIVEGNALAIDWNDVVPTDELDYIISNPPFVGARLMAKDQKNDVFSVFGDDWKNAGNLDYVACWYKKAADLMVGTKIRTALVSTNSVSQGESVANLWKPLFAMGCHIDFAHKTFRWDSEATSKAHVHCVIIGFSIAPNNKPKMLFDGETVQTVGNINAYLVDGPNIFIESRSEAICSVPKMDFGSMPNDGGFLSKYSFEQKEKISAEYPESRKYFKKLVGADEFIKNTERYCLWLVDISPAEIKRIKPIYKAVGDVRELRQNSSRNATKKLARVPHLFGEIRQPNSRYLLVPSTSSERRSYIPIGFMEPDVISNNANLVIPDATLYHFGILTSSVHMAWVRVVAGRLESRYRYSAQIVYNNFPWPSPKEEQKLKIEKTAKAILDVRAAYPDCSFADLYDDLTMPPDLRKAHQENDQAVLRAYRFSVEETEDAIVANLMKLYRDITDRQKKLRLPS